MPIMLYLRSKKARHDQAFDEIELLGFPLCSPFDLLEERPKQNLVLTHDLNALLNKHVSLLGYYVTRKPVTTVNGKLMSFGTWLMKREIF
jgi:DNA polymerase-3 subunit alpha